MSTASVRVAAALACAALTAGCSSPLDAAPAGPEQTAGTHAVPVAFLAGKIAVSASAADQSVQSCLTGSLMAARAEGTLTEMDIWALSMGSPLVSPQGQAAATKAVSDCS